MEKDPKEIAKDMSKKIITEYANVPIDEYRLTTWLTEAIIEGRNQRLPKKVTSD